MQKQGPPWACQREAPAPVTDTNVALLPLRLSQANWSKTETVRDKVKARYPWWVSGYDSWTRTPLEGQMGCCFSSTLLYSTLVIYSFLFSSFCISTLYLLCVYVLGVYISQRKWTKAIRLAVGAFPAEPSHLPNTQERTETNEIFSCCSGRGIIFLPF